MAEEIEGGSILEKVAASLNFKKFKRPSGPGFEGWRQEGST